MTIRLIPALLAALSATALAACSNASQPDAAATGTPTAATKLAIETATAQAADNLPLATVPGQVTLPPEARVAVTSPFPGAAVRVFVIEGQEVRRGQPLATVRAAQPVQIRGDLARAQAQLNLAEAQAQRIRQLADEGIIARARADEAQANVAQAHASVMESRRLASLAPTSADGTVTLTAPISGRVAHVAIDTGGPVDGMTAPFVIEGAGAYQIDLQLPERLARSVTPGMAITVQLPVAGVAPMEVGGTILSVAPSIDPQTRSVMAKASIGRAPGLVPGRNVSVTINAASGTLSGVSVPSGAVTQIGGEPHVFVREGATFTPRKVAIAAEAGGRSVVTQGLKVGDVVATSSIPELKAAAAE